jgi:hypothetical protein
MRPYGVVEVLVILVDMLEDNIGEV